MAERGRPSDYNPEFCKKVRKAISKGSTVSQVADLLNVDASTIYRWRNEHEEFREAFDASKEEADQIVVSALFQRATGFEVTAVKIFYDKDAGKSVEVPYREIVPPDVNAAKFWLTNRQKDKWQDKVNSEISGELGVSLASRLIEARKRVADKS